MKKMIVAVLVAVAAFSVWSLVSGASYLEAMLPGGLPLGNVLFPLGPAAVAGVAVLLSVPRTALRLVSAISLVVAALWLPVSILLAGNLTLNFSGWRDSAWLVYTTAMGLAVLGSLGWALVASLLAMRRRAGAV
jgi:hypothetical protein